MAFPIEGIDVDVSWVDADPNAWRSMDDPDPEGVEDDELDAVPDYVVGVLGFNPYPTRQINKHLPGQHDQSTHARGSSKADAATAAMNLEKNNPEISELLDMPLTGSAKTVREHTDKVFANWEERSDYSKLSELSEKYGEDIPKLMASAVVLHDIGKGLAEECGDREMQHEFTKPIMEEVLKAEGFSDKAVSIANSVMAHDIMGNAVQGMGSLETEKMLTGHKFPSVDEAASQLRAKAKEAGMAPEDFTYLQSTFYESDAVSYKFLKDNVFTQESDGSVVPKYPAYKELLQKASGAAEIGPLSHSPSSVATESKLPAGALDAFTGASGYSKDQVRAAFSGKLDKKSAVVRTALLEHVAKTGMTVKDAAIHVMEHDAKANAAEKGKYLASVLTGGGNIKAAVKNMQSIPLHDLQCTPRVEVMAKPKGGEASCNGATGKITLGLGYKLGTPRHELGHAIDYVIRGTRGGGSSMLKDKIIGDFDRAKALATKLNASWKGDPTFSNKVLGHEWFEENLGIAGRRDLDSATEHFAEEYRLYHREIYRDKYEGGGGKHLSTYRERHPAYADIFDTWYTASLIGNEA